MGSVRVWIMIIFGHPVTKRKVLEWRLALVATAGVGFLLAFVIIILGALVVFKRLTK